MKYYVYVYKDPIDSTVFYVGKGTGNRLYSHWKILENHYNSYMRDKLVSLYTLGLKPIIEKYKDRLENYEAFFIEHTLISEIGRLNIEPNGTLCNRSLGFEHFFLGRNFTIDEVKTFLSDKPHFNYISLDETEINSIISDYRNGKGLNFLSKKYSHGPDKIKQILTINNVSILKRGGQVGQANGMYGVKRENNDFFKGLRHTTDSKQQISKSLKGKNTNPIIVNNIKYDSVNSAAISTGIPRQTLSRAAKLNKQISRNGLIYNVRYDKGIYGEKREV